MKELKDYLFYQDDWGTIYLGDCRDILPMLEPVDLVLTDPPYGRNLSTGSHSGVNGFQITGDDNILLRDFALKLLPEIPAIVFGSPMCPRPKNIKAVLIWNKGEHVGMGDLNFPWKPSHEEIYVIGNGYHSDKRDGSVIYFPAIAGCVGRNNTGIRFHPVEKPVALLKYLLKRHESNLVLDPFMGSGTTLVAAKNLNRKSIGIEIEPKYCEIAKKRLRQEVFDFRRQP